MPINLTYNQTLGQFRPNNTVDIFVYPQEILSNQGFDFYSFILFGLFLMVLLGIYNSSKRTTGRGDFIGAFTVASWFTSITTIVLSLVTGTVGSYTITLVISVTIISTAILMLTSRNEGV